MPKVQIGGVELYYEQAGSGSPVVFVHGGFASLASFLRELQPYDWTWEWEFARLFQFIWYDRRGCYRSPLPQNADFSIPAQARDLEGLLDLLGIPSAHIVASSAGGPIGLYFTATRPQRVCSLTLVGTGLALFPPGDPYREIIAEQLRILETEGPEAAYADRPAEVETTLQVLWELMEAKARGELEALRKREKLLTKAAESLPRQVRVRYYVAELRNIQAYMDLDLQPYAEKITVRTLVLHGNCDRVVPLEWGKALADSIPLAEFVVIQNGPHGLLFRSSEARKRVIEHIRECECSR